MKPQSYPISSGVHAIPNHLLDLRSDQEIDNELLEPKPVIDDKNISFFWHTGYSTMHPYSQRNVRAWHRRFSRQGWTIRVLDRLPTYNTFQLLSAAIVNPLPHNVLIVLPDTSFKRIPMTKHTTELLFVVFQEQRYKDIGHWVMVRVDLISTIVQYIDVVDRKKDPGNSYFRRTCQGVSKLLRVAMTWKKLKRIDTTFVHQRMVVSSLES